MSLCTLAAYESNIWGRWFKPISNSSLDSDLFFQLSFSQLKKYIFPCTLLVCVNEWIKSWYWGGAFEINFNLSLGNDFTFELWYYSLNQIYQSQIACKLVLEDFKYLHSYPELHMITFQCQLWTVMNNNYLINIASFE